MTARDAFSLNPRQWEELEDRYGEVAEMEAEEMLAVLLRGATIEQQKYLALGVMVGRASR